MKNNCRGPISGTQGTTVHIHIITIFDANLLNCVQNFPLKPQNLAKYAYFPTLKNSPKIKNNRWDPISGMQEIIVHIHIVHAMFQVNLLNHVQNCLQKHQTILKYAHFPTFKNLQFF